MNHGSLFSGIGGFDLAAEWIGWNNIFHCEWNEFGQKVLKYHWPHAISYGDITKTDFSIHRGEIDILTGGFPCQPYSIAGKRKGKEDERHLWPEMLRAIREIQPTWIVGENVFGLINWNRGLVFHEVQSDLEAEGYEVQPYVLPACSVNAPHRRDRVWFVAYSGNNVHKRGLDNRGHQQKEGRSKSEHQGKGEASLRKRVWSESGTSGQNVTDTSSQRLQGQRRPEQRSYSTKNENRKEYRTFNACGWETEPTLRSRHNGLPTELDGITLQDWSEETIKAGGNAIVPQVAYELFKVINAYGL